MPDQILMYCFLLLAVTGGPAEHIVIVSDTNLILSDLWSLDLDQDLEGLLTWEMCCADPVYFISEGHLFCFGVYQLCSCILPAPEQLSQGCRKSCAAIG